MSVATFQQGSEEHMMFTDFWKLCRKYWGVEDNNDYWESLTNEMRDFYNKYNDMELAKQLIMAFKDTQEKALEKLRRK